MDKKYVIINGELYHWGIKGMKWGRRRYQNADGSLTPAGKKKYGHDDYQKAHSKKRVKDMSDKELRDRINRVRMEKEYRDLTSKTSKGKNAANKAIKTFIATAGTITAVTAAAATYKKFGNSCLDKIGDMVIKSINIGSVH